MYSGLLSSYEAVLQRVDALEIQVIKQNDIIHALETKWQKQEKLQQAKNEFVCCMVDIIVTNNKTNTNGAQHVVNYLRQYAMKLVNNIMSSLEVFHAPCMLSLARNLKDQLSTTLLDGLTDEPKINPDNNSVYTIEDEGDLFKFTRQCLSSFEQSGLALTLGDLYSNVQWRSARGIRDDHSFKCIRFENKEKTFMVYKNIICHVIALLDAFIEDIS